MSSVAVKHSHFWLCEQVNIRMEGDSYFGVLIHRPPSSSSCPRAKKEYGNFQWGWGTPLGGSGYAVISEKVTVEVTANAEARGHCKDRKKGCWLTSEDEVKVEIHDLEWNTTTHPFQFINSSITILMLTADCAHKHILAPLTGFLFKTVLNCSCYILFLWVIFNRHLIKSPDMTTTTGEVSLHYIPS